MAILCLALTILFWILLIGVLLSWIELVRPLPYSSPVAPLFRAIARVMTAVFRPFSGLIPPLRIGMVALDLSPILAFIVIGILRTVTCR